MALVEPWSATGQPAISLPLGATPIHFVAPSATVQFGPYLAPPMTMDVVCFDWTGGSLGIHSAVTRLVIQ